MRRGNKLFISLVFLCLAFACLADRRSCFAREDGRGIAVIGKDGRTAVERGDFYLVVIGINKYLNYTPLKTAVNDAREVKEVLLERYGFETTRLVELYDADATAKRIYAEIRTLAGKIKKDDSLFIYYAGHGYLDEITKSSVWVPVDGVKDDPTTLIDNDNLKKHLNVEAIKARHILLVSDSCFAGDFFARNIAAPKITDAYVRTAFGKVSREAITSGGIEQVTDKGFENHSVFAHFLLKALRENTEPYLLPAAVHERVKDGVSVNARQQPLYGLLTDIGGELGGSFVLFLKGAIGNLDELVRQKNERLDLLKQAEDEMKAKSGAEAIETKAREQKIAELDKQIKALQEKSGGDGQGDTSTIDQFVARAEQMRKKAEEKRRQREAEIARLKAKDQKRQSKALKQDVVKYKKVARSEVGKDLKDSAWNALLEKWGLQKGSVSTGDILLLYKIIGLEPPALTEFPAPTGFVKIGANPQGYMEYRHKKTDMVFVLIPARTFNMGSNDGAADEEPVHEVSLDSYLISKYEVTQEVWQKVMGNNPSYFKGNNLPVEGVSWDDCQEFYRNTGLRLPTEAEWEYACRAGTNTKYYWGDDKADGDYMWWSDNSGYTTHPVGEKKPNGFGLYDMSGNVWEWCEDWYGEDYYKSSPKHSPKGPGKGRYRVLRGGSWSYSNPELFRVGYRNSNFPSDRYRNRGFRVSGTF